VLAQLLNAREAIESLEPVFTDEECRLGEGFFRHARKLFAGILCVFQGKLTQQGGKMPAKRRSEL